MVQTYDNYYKAYYEKNRDKILERNKEYKKRSAREYYLKNRELILAKRKISRKNKEST